MKTIIHLCVIALLICICVVITRWITSNAAGLHANFQALVTLTLLIASIYVLYRLDKKRVKNASNKRDLEVQSKLDQQAHSSSAYELRASAKLFLFLIVSTLFGIGLIWFGYAIWKTTVWIAGFAVITGFTLTSICCLQINQLQTSPIIRIHSEGLTHYIFGLIPWNQIIYAYLTSWEMKSGKQFRLMLSVQDANIYIARFSWLHRRLYDISEGNTLKLHLPVTEADALVTEALAKEYIQKYSPQSHRTHLEEAKRLLAEVQELAKAPKTPENAEKMVLALEHSLANVQAMNTELEQNSQKFRKRIHNTNYAMIFFIVVPCLIYLWLKISK